MKIILSGGGTGGATTPLLGLYEEMIQQNLLFKEDVLWLGTKNGIEKKFVREQGIQFRWIFSGKWRRYWNLWNIFDLFFIIFGFFQSLWIIFRFQPRVVITVGGFVSVPVVWAAWILRKKILVHQQDIRTGLANKLMAPFADRITVTFEKSLQEFPREKVVWTGNPARAEILSGSREEAKNIFQLEDGIPTLLITGGGTGAKNLNEIIEKIISEIITFAQVIHLTGVGKNIGTFSHPRYHVYEMLTDTMKHALAVADLVVSRAGLSTLTELSLLGKPSIVIPLPHSHQEENARYFSLKNAICLFDEKNINPKKFVEEIHELLFDEHARKNLSENIQKIMPRNGREKIVKEIMLLI